MELWKELVDHHSKINSFFTRRKDGHVNFKTFITDLIKSKDAKIFIALEDNQIIGYTIAKIDLYPPIYLLEKYGSIYDMFVTLKYRRKGIGKRLWQEALKWFKQLGLERVELSIVPNNPESSFFWKKQGFQDYMHKLYIKIK
ncbi:MAG: GNAT family N-acetyltransferase [Candidatus Thorarchaeota archaeon]